MSLRDTFIQFRIGTLIQINCEDFTVGLSVTEAGVDDPDQQFYENYVCGAERNYTGYCSPGIDKLIDQQSMEPDQDKRKKLVWEIERRLAEDGARPVIFYPRGGTCRQPWVKGLTIKVKASTTAGATRTSGSTSKSTNLESKPRRYQAGSREADLFGRRRRPR
jgi:ABC-type transport system substrate-binding protein